MKPRESAQELLQVMRDWLKENVEPNERGLVMAHVHSTLKMKLKNVGDSNGKE